MSTRSFARRHRDELGEVVRVIHGGPGWRSALALFLVWLLLSGLTLINPAESAAMIAAPPIAFALIFGGIFLKLSGERLVICERGLLIGNTALGGRPYLLRYEQITPGSIVPFEGGILTLVRETKQQISTTIRPGWWLRRGIYLVGPSAQEARRGGGGLARLLDPSPSTVDRRWMWVASVPARPQEVTAAIARAAHSAGCEQLAQYAAEAPLRALTGRPEDAADHLPGQGVWSRHETQH